MDIVEKYKEYRKIQIGLHSKILDKCVSAVNFQKSAKILDIVKNNQIVLESNYEQDSIFDFTIYEKINEGKNVLAKYIELGESTTTEEENLLAAMEKSYTSLFEVAVPEDEKGTLILKDVLHDSNDTIKVVDIGLSQTLTKNNLIFARLQPLDEFSITSGLVYVFNANHKDFLLKRSRKLMKKLQTGDTSIDRFIAFFNLNRSDGLKTRFNQ